MADEELSIFSAVSSSARQLLLLLQCLALTQKTHVQITDDGLRFSVDDSSTMESSTNLGKELFTTYQYREPAPLSSEPIASDASDDIAPVFAISLPSLIETLQISGIASERKTNPSQREPFGSHAFSNQVLGVPALCRMSYTALGDPFLVILEESGFTTIAELNTYEPSFTTGIPFDRGDLVLKVVMRASYLLDAITEISAINPQNVTFTATRKNFSVSASSEMGSAVVDFHRDARPSQAMHSQFNMPQKAGEELPHPSGLLDTFELADGQRRFSQSYRFSHIVQMKKALQAAVKVVVRADHQSVLNLQFMVQNLEGSNVSFVDFKFVPLLDEEADGLGMSADEEEDEDGAE